MKLDDESLELSLSLDNEVVRGKVKSKQEDHRKLYSIRELSKEEAANMESLQLCIPANDGQLTVNQTGFARILGFDMKMPAAFEDTLANQDLIQQHIIHQGKPQMPQEHLLNYKSKASMAPPLRPKKKQKVLH